MVSDRIAVGGYRLAVKKKTKGLVPCVGEALRSTEAPLPCGKRRGCVLHHCHARPLPMLNKPHRNKQEGKKEAEEERAVVGHDLFDVVNASVKCICAQHNSGSTTLSRVNDCTSNFFL